MTYDVVVLASRPPDVPAVVAGLVAAGEDLLVWGAADGAVIQLCAPHASGDGGLSVLLTVEEPVFVPVPAEVSRLLGADVARRAPTPLWWVRVRAPDEPTSAAGLAHRFAAALIERLGGVAWPSEENPGG
ncbi:hypothetical protein AWW66_00220 [Micromonospora rosaria]|uniref:Uncharacterized protein n=1 Tax=Micromonospora rosaria TaxID=47874 RepID=A0A136PZU4_9ACTN|nr:hypothetical protein [Micromonospora rosaria]KXK63917.1 hypothetical protein AWW66_00220 [Micromonospora rosaria]